MKIRKEHEPAPIGLHRNMERAASFLSDEKYVKLYDAVKTYWKDYTSLITFSPDHGAHRIGKIFLGTHGSEIPSDMNIVHFFSVLGGNDE